MTEENEEKLNPYQQASYDAYTNAQTAEEKMEVMMFVTGVKDPATAIKNVAFNATNKSVRVVLAAALVSLYETDNKEFVLQALQDIARLDYQERGFVTE